MDNILNAAIQHGALGLVVLACFWYINKQDENEKKNRDNLIATLMQQNSQMIAVIESNTKAMAELSIIIKSK